MEGSQANVPHLVEVMEVMEAGLRSDSVCQICGHTAPDAKTLLLHLRLHLEGSEDLTTSCEQGSPGLVPTCRFLLNVP